MSSIWNCGKFKFNLEEPLVMGILNVTPDSFSDGGAHDGVIAALAHAEKLRAEGADIIDVGGESTRPGADPVAIEEELNRVLPVVRELAAAGAVVSIDTRHAQVAAACVEAGACIINDVSGFRDRAMREVAASCNAGLVLMHMQGTPQTMQDNPEYEDVVSDVARFFTHMTRRLTAEGVAPERICLDPGIGFGKNVWHNQELVDGIPQLLKLGFPLMAAVSRKGYIGTISGIENPAERDEASALCAAYMVGLGARVIRAHNVAMTKQMLATSHRAIIGLGSNMGDTMRTFDEALESLAHTPGVWLGTRSEYLESEPAYYEDQATFLNAVAAVQTTLLPIELLHLLQSLENEHGRVRTIANGPRTLDLDIVDYEGVISNTEELMLPHPLALERGFVVVPLLSILPGYVLADGTPVTYDNLSVGNIVS